MSNKSTLTRDAVVRRVFDLILEIIELDPALLHEDATIDGELEMHSVAFVELQVAIEESFDVLLDPIEMVERNRLGDIIDYILECAAESRP